MPTKKMVLSRLVLIFMAALCGRLWAGAADRENVMEPDILRLISYNVQFLPGIARFYNKRADPEYRAKKIAEAMVDYDVVGLNEVFDEECRDILIGEMKRISGDDCHFVVHEKPLEGKFVTSGGLLIATRLPIIASHQTTYTAFSTYEEFGFQADGLASKGVLHVRLLRDGGGEDDYLDVFVTHLEARKDAVRPQQIRELAAFVTAHSDSEHPVVIMGDMNIDGRLGKDQRPQSQYKTFMATLRHLPQTASINDLWVLVNGRGAEGGTVASGKRLDYILLSNPVGENEALKPLRIRVNPFVDPKVESLSDHSAVEAELQWK